QAQLVGNGGGDLYVDAFKPGAVKAFAVGHHLVGGELGGGGHNQLALFNGGELAVVAGLGGGSLAGGLALRGGAVLGSGGLAGGGRSAAGVGGGRAGAGVAAASQGGGQQHNGCQKGCNFLHE